MVYSSVATSWVGWLPQVFVLLLLAPPPSTPDWTSECVTRYPAYCRCTWSSGKRLADCNKSNLNELPVLSSEIQILDMSNNKLTVLHDNAFTNANLINLQKLYLKGCRINRVHELAFNNLRIMVELDLSYNEIEFIDPIVFSTNMRIGIIRLNNNRLHTLREFPSLEYLHTLELSHNNLNNLSHHTFSGLRGLKSLDLSYNQFTNLNPEMFSRLSSLKLRGNAWVCDCELKPLRDYIVMNKFYEPELRCAEPLNLFNSAWDGFDELSCKPEILHILANGKIVDSIVALENTLVLSCVVKGDPLPDVKWVKNGRVVQEVHRDATHIGGGTVVLNLTVGRHDNEFVCVGSNSGGVVERNLTVTLDEAGLSGFVVLKDGVDGGLGGAGGISTGKDKGGLLIYLVIGVVFLSLIVGLVVGGVCVWRWGQRGGNGRPVQEHDSVVKGVLKDDNDQQQQQQPHDVQQHQHQHQQQFLVEQSPLLKPHASADDLLGENTSSATLRQRPTPDLLINNNGGVSGSSPEELEDIYNNKFPLLQQQDTPQDTSSLYDNYELVYRPLLGGPDSLRRYCLSRDYATLQPNHHQQQQRPSSVCSEPRNSIVPSAVNRNSPVMVSHGYVTLPRRSLHKNKKELPPTQLPIKYDNLGPRTTADGSSSMSLNDCGVDTNTTPKHFEPILEQPVDEETLDLQQSVASPSKKFRPVPPPKPKKKSTENSDTAPPPPPPEDDDGTEV